MALLHFRSKRVAETALLASWFWASLARFAGIRGIFSSPEDSMLTPDELSFQWYEYPRPACASWFWRTSGRYSGTWRIFSSPRDFKVTLDGLGLQWNGDSKTFWTLTVKLLGRNIAPLYFKTERVAETVLRESWFWPISGRFPGACRIYSSPASSILTPYGLCFRRNGQSRTFLTLTF